MIFRTVLDPYFRVIQRKLGQQELSLHEETTIAATIGKLMQQDGLTREQAGHRVVNYLKKPNHPFWQELADARRRSQMSACHVCGAEIEFDEMSCAGCTQEYERLSQQQYECPDCHNQAPRVNSCDLCMGNGTIDGLTARDVR